MKAPGSLDLVEARMVSSPAMSPTGQRRVPPVEGAERDGATDATVPADDGEAGGADARVLHVTGPHGGARYVLPEGLVTLGRGAEATIIVADPRVSRSHAALHVTAREVMLSDLGSANGTFVGDVRLAKGEARRIENGQSFSLGDSVLVVRASTLADPGPKRLSSFEQVRARFEPSALGMPPLLVTVRVRPTGRVQTRTLELVLSEIIASPRDFMLWQGDGKLLLGVEVAHESDAATVEGAVIRKLASFSVSADVSVRTFNARALERAGSGLPALLGGEAPITLVRGKIVLEHPAMKALEDTVLRVARATVSVLVLGETGSGKDVVAAMLHEFSQRAQRPFVVLNCASLPESLLESELFGYERGAFTGAVSAKQGLLEVADGGTVFLDEVGELSASLQAKLLRVIESNEVVRLGALKPRAVDVRFVAATNRDLTRDVAEGRFRRDLYYRLSGVTLEVPPLRERTSDIEPLARLFLDEARTRYRTDDLRFSRVALAALLAHAWPGNVRELKSAVERAVLLARGSVIEPADLGLATPVTDSVPAVPSPSSTQPVEVTTTPDLERERIVRALEECGGNQSRAATLLGMSRRTLVRKIAALALRRPRERS